MLCIVGGDYTYSGGGRAGSSSSSPKKSIKREKTDEETKEVLDHVLRDDVRIQVILFNPYLKFLLVINQYHITLLFND